MKNSWDVHNSVLSVVMSWTVSGLITQIIKIAVGRPRPDFIDRCQPIPGSHDAHPYGLSNVTICTQTNAFILADGHKSFPSGHSSLSFAGLGLLSFYLAGKLHLFSVRGHQSRAWLAFAPLLGGAMVAVSRTMDNRHHWTDVTVGSILGLTVAYVTYRGYYPPLSHARSHLPYAPREVEEDHPLNTIRTSAHGYEPVNRNGEAEQVVRRPSGEYGDDDYTVARNAGPRPAFKEDRTTFLPKGLLDQIDGGQDVLNAQRGDGPKGRKAERKFERDQKKSTRGPSQSRSSGSTLSTTSASASAPTPTKRSSLGSEDPSSAAPSSTRKKLPSSTPLSKLLSGSSSSSKKTSGSKKRKISTAEKNEDDEIAWLEYHLGRGRKGPGEKDKKKKKKLGEEDGGEGDDGLDELLDDLDRLEEEELGLASSDEEDMEGTENEEMDEEDMSDDEAPELVSYAEDTSEWKGIAPVQDDASSEVDETSSFDEDEDEDEMDEPTSGSKQVHFRLPSSSPPPAPDTAAVSTIAAPGGKYIPPALRARMLAESAAQGDSEENAQRREDKLKLTKAGKGLLNRLGENNIEGILGEIEGLYRKHPRNDVTSTLTTLILETISSHANLLGSFVVLYAALVAGLYKIMGVDFGANLVQTLVIQLINHLSNSISTPSAENDDGSPAGKEGLNLITLLAELYNFQVVSSVLMYDLVRRFLDSGLDREQGVEGLLKIVRNAGPQLRQDDPTALKDIIMIVQQKVAGINPDDLNSRTKYMLETLTNLKNNRVKAAPGGEASAEATQRMKKFLNGLAKKKPVLAHEPLRVSLSDLLSADTKGKWWLVGAGWGGNPLVDRQETKKQAVVQESAMEEDELLQLARKQGMNTDIRRRVFVTIMGSSDFMDAHDQLLQLGLTDIQQREIVRVLLHCSGNEKIYNPFYTLVLSHLLSLHTHKFTFQYSLWDFLREMGEGDVGGAAIVQAHKGTKTGKKKVPVRQIRNWAKVYGWCIAKEGATLALFKPVNFTALRPQTELFFLHLITALILSTQTTSPVLLLPGSLSEPVASPLEQHIMKVANLPSLCEGLLYFLTTSMAGEDWLDTVGVEGKKERKVVRWGVEVWKERLSMEIEGRGGDEE
ncbi:Protein involved in high osmolarity signaling pathway [Phaffia rhodozyma]|uniref:Protein involved in high osmolarity signaling pathway n=1 Tax=Phaffia rhodozyma TaxID=264483 RepID=A0A0F7SF90_PHARH|nr:Protein involved in high osmolarity signaling pathway [Phaffia rhodozyma]